MASKGVVVEPTRRSLRLSSKNDFELKPRPPIKRKYLRKPKDSEATTKAVNGAPEEDLNDEESPSKIKKLEETETAPRSENGNGIHHDDEEDTDMEASEVSDEDMHSEDENMEEERFCLKEMPEPCKESVMLRDKWNPVVVLKNDIYGDLLKPKTQILNPEKHVGTRPTSRVVCTSFTEPSSSSAAPLENSRAALINRKPFSPSQDYVTKKPIGSVSPTKWNTTDLHVNYLHHSLPSRSQPARKITTEEFKKSPSPTIAKASSNSSSRGYVWYVPVPFILAVLLVWGLLWSQKLPTQADTISPQILDRFDLKMSGIQTAFPSQHALFWKRSGKHLKRHLQTLNPTEPVSLVLTAGSKAQRTLSCLARHLALAYSASLNTSMLEIFGSTRASQGSDQVKLELDGALNEAFSVHDNTAAVVHNFEELPPGSTLIFYRYCDHENAAYKKVFLAFTVMLSVDRIEAETSLSAVESMVHERLNEKFIHTDQPTKFNEMDVDKLSGLWSRISHVILPVSAEERIEQQGCTV